MSALLSRGRSAFCLTVLVFVLPSAARAQATPLPADQQAKVNDAIDKGVRYLKGAQGPLGTWANEQKHVSGYTALPALTLLECGVDPKDRGIQAAANIVRRLSLNLDGTYEISLSILFLDRLGDPGDKLLIQMLAARLIAGQVATGGWSYKCPNPTDKKNLLTGADGQVLLNVLAQLEQQQKHNEEALAALDRPLNPNFKGDGTDKADPFLTAPDTKPSGGTFATQSATYASLGVTEPLADSSFASPRRAVCIKTAESMPVAASPPAGKNDAPVKPDKPPVKPKPVTIPRAFHGLPVFWDTRGLALVDPSGTRSDNSNTQFAVLALLAARRHDVPVQRTMTLLVLRFRTSQANDGSWNYHHKLGGDGAGTPQMTCVGLLGLAVGHGSGKQPGAHLVADPQVVNGLVALSRHVGTPTGQMDKPVRQHNLYYLWSLERVGVLYDQRQIGGKDWYRWGAEQLVTNQQAEGNWRGGGYHGSSTTLDTCLALLFLKRANLTTELSASLTPNARQLEQKVDSLVASLPRTEPTPPTIPDPPPVSPPDTPPITSPPVILPSNPPPVIQPPAQPQTPAEQPKPAAKEGGSLWWLWLLIGLGVLLMLAATLLLVLRKKGRGAADDSHGRSDDDYDDDYDDEDDEPSPRRRGSAPRRRFRD